MDYPEDKYDEMESPDLQEAWVYATMASLDEIIREKGMEYFLDHLPRYSKIALLAWRREKYET